ncbi:MAG: hypothetical protein MR297_02390 [Tenericutes bacterium]|nr:hypothetical protein [Mycoplasmatota bacterium]
MINKLKENKLILIIFIIGIILIVTGVTYSLYNILFVGKKEQTVVVGNINFTYNEKTNGLSLNNDDILDNTSGINQEKHFDFDISLNSSNNISITYQIAIEEDKTNTLSNDKIKLYLTDQNNNKIKDPVNISDLKLDDKGYRKLYINTINQNGTQKYRLRAWVDVDKAYETTNNGGTHSIKLNTASYKFKVNVYDTEKPIPATDTLIALTNNQNDSGLYTITHPADSTLQIGATESVTEYRYRGASPKNYVTFNNETWRIIGVFPTDDGTGKIENRVKLIRDESIGDKYWNNCIDKNRDFICDDTNKAMNDWTGATLNTYLNGTYLNSLDSTSKSLISNAKYYLGGLGIESNDEQGKIKVGQTTGIQLYNYERKMQNGNCSYNSDEGCYLGTGCYYYGTNPNSFTEKLGLMYSSDYFYASENCENKMMFEFDSNTGDIAETSTKDIRACNTTNWLYNL